MSISPVAVPPENPVENVSTNGSPVAGQLDNEDRLLNVSLLGVHVMRVVNDPLGNDNYIHKICDGVGAYTWCLQSRCRFWIAIFMTTHSFGLI